MAFKLAASMGLKEGVHKGNPILLEPMMKVEVEVPENFLGDVMGDLNSRRGQIEGMGSEQGLSKVTAKVPLAEMFGYATALRSMTQGRASYAMEFDHYAPVSQSVAQEIMKRTGVKIEVQQPTGNPEEKLTLMLAGGDFIKTRTGKVQPAATLRVWALHAPR